MPLSGFGMRIVLISENEVGSSRCSLVVRNPTSVSEDVGLISRLNPTRLWCRLAATAPVQPLAWEHPYAKDVALKRQKKK